MNNDKITYIRTNTYFTLMSKANSWVFKGLLIVAWVIFVGLCIEAGGLVVNLFFALFEPGLIHNLYQKLDIMELYKVSIAAFLGVYSFIIAISVLKALLFYVIVRLMHKIDLLKPFNAFVSKQFLQVSYLTLSIGFLGYVARQFAKNLAQHSYLNVDISQFWVDSQAFVLMGAVVYIIATIFKKGVDLQNESDLTV